MLLAIVGICYFVLFSFFFFFQAEDGIRDAQESRGLGDVYKRQIPEFSLRYTPRDNIQIQFQMISGSILNPYKNNYLQNW